jgi:tetratricopeptide (TPR) repeat protein
LRAEPDSVLVLTGKKELLITLAKLHYQNSEFDKCLQYFKDAMVINVSHINFSREIATGLLDLANHYVASGNSQLAITCFSESCNANTDDKQVKIDALLCCSRTIIRTRSLDHCESLLSRARELIGDDECPQFNVALYEYKGLKQRRCKDYKGAIQSYKKLLAIEPENIIGLSGLGVLCRSDEPALALSCIEKALVLQPNSLRILGIKAMYHKEHHEFDRELDCYNNILQLEPNNYFIKQHRIGLFHRREHVTDDGAREP